MLNPCARTLRTAALLASWLLLPSCFFFSGDGAGSAEGSSGGGPPAYDADLEITTLLFSPTVVDAGEPILVTDVVRNSGTETVSGFRVGVYLSVDAQIDTSDQLLGFRSLASLAANSEDTGGGELTIPLATTAGSYWVGAIADDLNEVGENDEGNNARVAGEPLEVQAPLLPDLVPTVVTFSPAVVDAGQTLQVDDVVENQGQAASGPFQVGIYLSSDPLITPADILIGLRQVVDLGPSAGSSGSGTVTVPSDTPAGIYYLGTLADDTDSVYEQDEGNNQGLAGSTLEVKVPPLPDLVPTHLAFAPTSVNAGQEITVGEGVLNQGNAAANTFQVGVYLSADSVIDDSDILLGFRTVAFLSDGDESAVSGWPLEVPADTPAGSYWVGVWADDGDAIPESLEINNTLTAVTPLEVDVPPLPNLRPASLDFSPGVVNVDEGELLTISEVVENIGTAAAGTFRVGVYLSANSVVSPSDVLVASRVITALGPGGTSGATKSVSLPPGLSDGSYFVGVVVDDLAEVGEVSEGDNVLVAEQTLDIVSTPDPQPDLIMEECSYSGNTKAPGEQFQVVTRVTNEGDLSAGPFWVGIYLSTDATIGPDDVLLGERHLIGGLSAGFSNVASAPVTIPQGQPEGTYYVGAFADNKYEVVELEEDDNDFTTPGTLEVKIPPPPAPELYVLSATHDAVDPLPGDTFTLDETIRNKGELDAGAFRVGYYLSSDGIIDSSDVLLGARTIASLAVGDEDSASTLLTIPPSTAPGEYWIAIWVDDQQAVTENDEDDNVFKVLPKITVQ